MPIQSEMDNKKSRFIFAPPGTSFGKATVFFLLLLSVLPSRSSQPEKRQTKAPEAKEDGLPRMCSHLRREQRRWTTLAFKWKVHEKKAEHERTERASWSEVKN